MKTTFVPLLAAGAVAFAPVLALAQTAPPSVVPMTAPTPPPSSTGTMAPAPAATSMSEPSSAPATAAPYSPAPKTNGAGTGTGTGNNGQNSGKHLGQIKKLQSGSLSTTDLRYALTHPLQEANQVRKLKTISFDKLRVYRLSSGLKSMFKLGDANSDIPSLAVLGPGILIAQTSGLPATNGSNSPIAYLQYVLANINVSNALNNVNVLNNSTVNVGVTLQDVLNGNKISIGSVAGIFVNSLGIITTITK
jgi:hypothetical protein